MKWAVYFYKMQNLIEAIFKIHKSGLLGRSVKIFKKKQKKNNFQLKNTSFVSKKHFAMKETNNL